MQIVKKYKKYFIRRHLNLFKTVYFNFRVFPLKIAIRLPVFVYGRVCFEGLHRGCIKFTNGQASHPLHLGGGYYTWVFGCSDLYRSYFRFDGTLICGKKVILDQGSAISVSKDAILEIGDNVVINRNSRIHCRERITIEKDSRLGWDCQVFDTNFHFTLHNNRIANYSKPVFIGHNSWLANGVSVQKGSYLPAYSVVASKSLVNKDFSDIGEKCLLGGVPAHLLSKDICRILDLEKEREIKAFFKKTNQDYVEIDQIQDLIPLMD